MDSSGAPLGWMHHPFWFDAPPVPVDEDIGEP
jgi:hypothetical protein